jgi:hypothetical protein
MMFARLVRMLFVGVMALLIVSPAASAQAAAKEIYRYSFKGESADVDMFSYGECTFTRLYLNVVDGRIKTERNPDRQSAVWGFIEQYDYCTDTGGWLDFGAELDANAFRIDRKLDSATLSTTIEACGYDTYNGYGCFPLELNITWSGTGDTFQDKSRSQWKSRYYKGRSSYDSTSREALISGAVTAPWGAIPLEDAWGWLRSVKNAYISMWRL